MSVKTSAMTPEQFAELLKAHGSKHATAGAVKRFETLRTDQNDDVVEINLLTMTSWLAQEYMRRGYKRKTKD